MAAQQLQAMRELQLGSVKDNASSFESFPRMCDEGVQPGPQPLQARGQCYDPVSPKLYDVLRGPRAMAPIQGTLYVVTSGAKVLCRDQRRGEMSSVSAQRGMSSVNFDIQRGHKPGMGCVNL